MDIENEKDSEPKDEVPAEDNEQAEHTEPSSAEEEDAASRIQSLNDKIAELEELRLRMAAENQNTRKRLVKQQQDAYKYRHQDILRDMAEVMDNFERAIESSAESRDFDTFHEGIVMIEKQFSGMLTEKYALERIGEEGETFDPAAHEAMMMNESADVEVETVAQVFQAGYRLHDRVLRPAKVVVSKPASISDDESENEGDK